MERPDCFGYSLFCDDIRQEVGGKTSFIGAYHGTMFIGRPLPTTLPKLGMVLSLCRTPRHIADHPGNVVLTVRLPSDPEDKPSVVAEVSGDQMEKLAELDTIKTGLHTHAQLEAHMLIAPFPIIAFGPIIATATLPNGEAVKLGSLIISQGTSPAAT